jgi:GNAT superfamily N-acetyltransferase
MLATFARIGIELKHLLKQGRIILFYCDLGQIAAGARSVATSGSIDPIRTASQLNAGDRAQILKSGNPVVINPLIEQRFARGASLWLYKICGRIAGYGWTLVGHTMEPHFFPLCPEDIHFFDFFVFPEHRGKRINPILVNVILERMSYMSKGRAYIESAEWNQPQIASLQRTPFQRIAVATKYTLFGRTTVKWWA